MIIKKRSRKDLRKAIFGVLFVIMGIFAGATAPVVGADTTYAVEGQNQTVEATEENTDSSDDKKAQSNDGGSKTNKGSDCKDSLEAIGWLVCPTTGKIAEAVDWLYSKIQGILTINPVSAEDGSPIYEVWKYCLSLTNIVFVIFLLVVIYSQITGYGITNYGIKKALPKLIVTAILVNLSFLICSLAVDVSNILGNGIRGIFTTIQDSVIANSNIDSASLNSRFYWGIFEAALAGGSFLALAFEPSIIWMLIPTVLGAVVAVATGLITIALRQAVVMLLIMIAPLAIVAYILPNTEQWFKKWKQLLTTMLVFYPMFSLLFGASSLAGFAIITSAKDGFWLLLGVAVQIFPLFFSWKLMQMSGTFLGTINTKMRSLAEKPLATNRAWADSHRQLSKQKHLASGRVHTPSLRLMQFVNDQKIRRDAETDEYAELNKTRALAGRALKNYDKDGKVSKRGQKAYERQARNMRYRQIIEMNKDNFNRGLGGLGQEYKNTISDMKKDFKHSTGVYSSVIKGKTLEDRLTYLDDANVSASDDLKFEMARGAKIEYENAKGFQDRVTKAMNAHFDQEAINAGNEKYQLHGVLGDSKNIERYNSMKKIMEGKKNDVHFAAADAAYGFNAQAQIVQSKFQKYMDLTAPTQDVVHRLHELTTSADSSTYIDPIVAGLRTLNMRGDTDLVRKQIHEVMKDRKVELGTYTSQSLANFLMFDVKGNDPFLRRFGKYINLETAKMYNEAEPEERRTRKDISLYEYVNGEYVDYDENGRIKRDNNGRVKIGKPKKSAKILLRGTSFKDMERTAISNMLESIREYSVSPDENGRESFDFDKFVKNESEIWNAVMPNIISDQFSFLSGSEQIEALGRGITGVDVKNHAIDWKGIFGEYVDSLTPEQKAEYSEILNKRTKTFLAGHVPVQIAKTKTDMLDAVKTQFALMDKIRNGIEYDENGNITRVNDPDIFGLNYKDNKEGYDQLEEEHLENIQREFAGAFKRDALEGFGKMYRKGYQGEAKDGLIKLLKPELDRQARTNRTSSQDDDGMPVTGGDEPDSGAGAIYNEARSRIDEIYRGYNGLNGGENVMSFWNRIKNEIVNDASMQSRDLTVLISDIESRLSQFTDVGSLYDYVMNSLFGGY